MLQTSNTLKHSFPSLAPVLRVETAYRWVVMIMLPASGFTSTGLKYLPVKVPLTIVSHRYPLERVRNGALLIGY